ncbi:unnamed protein product [Prorocentrum cordatum]|uniref:EF-hand domain-containing protein n=1 Tax=Prorocentrum cordatum TaxID=2364126 RepID=A0ABN9SDY1_9DINO|nr:unnamed protein product [Polarella glacialis]
MHRAPTSASVAAAAAAAWLLGSRSFSEGGLRGVGGGARWRVPPGRTARAAAAGPERGADAPEDSKDLFGALNRDGAVPLSDMMALMDEDGDGTISREEFENFKNKMGSGGGSGGSGGGVGGGDNAGGGGPGGGDSSPTSGGSGPPLAVLALAALAVVALALAALSRRGRRAAAGGASGAPDVRPGRGRGVRLRQVRPLSLFCLSQPHYSGSKSFNWPEFWRWRRLRPPWTRGWPYSASHPQRSKLVKKSFQPDRASGRLWSSASPWGRRRSLVFSMPRERGDRAQEDSDHRRRLLR